MKKSNMNDIENFAFVGAEFARVDIESVKITTSGTRGWHSQIEEKELRIYANETTTKTSIISKISTALSKKSRMSKIDIETYIKELN